MVLKLFYRRNENTVEIKYIFILSKYELHTYVIKALFHLGQLKDIFKFAMIGKLPKTN